MATKWQKNRALTSMKTNNEARSHKKKLTITNDTLINTKRSLQ